MKINLKFFLPLVGLLLFFLIYFFLKSKSAADTFFLSPLPQSPLSTSAFSLQNSPSQSLKGQITSLTGEIHWQSRTASAAAKITSPVTVQQGEILTTGPQSKLSLSFPDTALLNFSPETAIEIIQTLPANLVFRQTQGEAEYLRLNSSPQAIRVKNLLVQNDGQTTISLHPSKPTVTVSVGSGSAQIAFNDPQLVTQLVSLPSGQTYLFNTDTRQGALE